MLPSQSTSFRSFSLRSLCTTFEQGHTFFMQQYTYERPSSLLGWTTIVLQATRNQALLTSSL